MKAVAVHLMDIDARLAIDNPFGDSAANPAGVCDPHSLGEPNTFQVHRGANEGVPVRGEGKNAVNALDQIRRLQAGKQFPGRSERGCKVLVTELPERVATGS